MEGQAPLGGEEGAGEAQHPELVQNENPAMIIDGFYMAVQLLQTYGWFLVLGIALLFYLKHKLNPSIEKWRKKREEQESYEFDAGVTRTRQGAMEAARQRMQQKLDEQAVEYTEKLKEKEEEKRREKIEDWDRHQQGKGYRSKIKFQDEASTSSSSGKPKKKVYKTDEGYSALSGGGGGGAFSRPRRGNTGGG